MNKRKNFLVAREKSARRNINRISTNLKRDRNRPKFDDLCMYITGSYGRLEASENSDLDLFFIRNGSSNENPISHVDKTMLDASIIKTCRSLKFPEFTDGGIYLNIHYLRDMMDALGNPSDDYYNFFTARMLLLLESRPILNDQAYETVIGDLINTYFRDYHAHEKDFQPVFLVNDIRRFWLTMCLNYEHKRNRNEGQDRIEKNKAHLKNLKLKFSRLLTCYSMIASILAYSGSISPDAIKRLVRLTPQQRLRELSENNPDFADLVDSLLEEYAWFLEKTGAPKNEALKWIGIRRNRDNAFKRARKFSKIMNDLIFNVTEDSYRIRYLMI